MRVIDDLYALAVITASNKHGFSVTNLDVAQELVALVVSECSSIAELKEQGYGDYDKDISVGWYMREHFGLNTKT